MTFFVLGILAGWAIEYAAFKYWWKDKLNPRGQTSSERTEYEARLAAKDREITQLQQKLLNVSNEKQAVTSPVDAAPKKAAPKKAAPKKAAPKKAAPKKAAPKKAAPKKAAPKKAAPKKEE